ncbi:MAG TPA: AsmA family protein, partial [Steroidobacteraceae bacterium]
GRQLKIGGELGLDLFPWIAIEINDVSLGNPPGYGDDPFLTVKRADVGVKLLPLLSKRLEVRRVAVDGLAVTLISRGEEENNWKDLGGGEEAESDAGGPAPQTTIAGVDVTNSTLVFRDEVEKSVIRLLNLKVHTGPLGGSDPVRAEMEFDYDEGNAPTVAHVALDTQVAFPQDGSRLQVTDLNIRGDWFGSPDEDGGKKEASKPVPFAVSSKSLVVDMDAGTLAPATFDVKFGELPLQITASGEKLFDDYVISGKLSAEGLSPRKLMPAFGMEVPVTADPNVLKSLALKSDYRLTEKQLRLSSLDLTLDDTRVRGSAAIEDLDTMALSFDLNVDAINVDRYLEPQPKDKGKGAAGTAQASEAEEPPTELPIEALRELQARGTLRIGRATLADLPFTDIRLPLDANKGLVKLGPTHAGLFGGSYDGNIVLDVRPAQARLSMNERVQGIDIGALMKAAFETDRVSGRGNATANLTGTGNTDAAIMKSLAGKLQADVKNGAIEGLDLWYEIRRARALLRREAVPERTGPARTTFNALTASATLDKGVLRNDDLNVDAQYLRATGKGTLDLGTDAVDYRLAVRIYKLPEEGAGAEMKDLLAAEIPVTITGSLQDMKVRPDLAGMVKERVRSEVNERVEEKKQELKEKLGDKLRDLLKR